jgi:DNA polymerase-3 subunit alpha
MKMGSDQFYIKTPKEMKNNYNNLDNEVINSAIQTSNELMEKCEVELETGEVYLPKVDYNRDKYKSPTEKLMQLATNGAKEKLGGITKEVKERAKKEIEIIDDMGYSGYFIIVRDFIKWAEEQGIMVGPGRGSAAGSLISYLIGITKVNPLKHGLLFERFLNPERVYMADIDIDFTQAGRDKVIEYTKDKYGEESTAQIVTFGILHARSVVRDVTRALDQPYGLGDKIAKAIPQGQSLDEALEDNKKIIEMYENNNMVKKIIDIAKRLEGIPRHTSMHAAGVVIADGNITDYVPVKQSDGNLLTQTAKEETEELGLLKMDFLGLRNLDVIKQSLQHIKERHNIEIDINNLEGDFDDPKVYELFQKGNTLGIFQFESSGMQRLLRKLKPTNLDHIIAANALYRPGPNQFQDEFIAGRFGKEIEYPHLKTKDILDDTMGIILYQEQIMQIVQKLAGFSLGQSDILRRGIGKKKPKLIKKMRNKFIYGDEKEDIPGCINKGISEEKAKEIFDIIKEFANYGFNKSHSTAYSYIAYQTAYLKAHYPIEFMASLLTSVAGNEDKLRLYLKHTKDLSIDLKRVNINKSKRYFSIEENSIRVGMESIKGVGSTAVDEILIEREERGDFKNLYDFCKRVSSKVNKRNLMRLIAVGAFDQFGSRKGQLQVFEKVMKRAKKARENENQSQMALFSNDTIEVIGKVEIPDIETDKEEALNNEREFLGYFISGHPLEEYQDKLPSKKIRDLPEKERPIELGGIITDISAIMTRNDNPMAFLEIEDLESTITVIVFPDVYEKYMGMIKEGRILRVAGRITLDEYEQNNEEGEVEVKVEKKIIAKKLRFLN